MTPHKYATSERLSLREVVRERGLRYAMSSGISAVAKGLYWGTRRRIWALHGRLLSRRVPPPFEFRGQSYRYFWHTSNATWRNERAVEIPVVRGAMAGVPAERTLEVGNVLGQYGVSGHDVVDKFDRAPGVLNEDILDYDPPKRYELIVSISTIEHVGWDDDPRDPDRALQALGHIRSLLAPGGRALITVPYGYNDYLDQLVGRGEGFDEVHYLRRTGRRTWEESNHAAVVASRYGEPHPGANALVIGMLRSA